MVDEFIKIVPSAFGPFIGHHQRLLACVKNVFKEFFFYNITKLRKHWVGWLWDADDIEQIWKIEHYQQKYNISRNI